MKETIEDLSDSLSEVIAFEEENEQPERRKQLVMQRYILDNLQYWLLADQGKDDCNLDVVPILYFYATDCPSCPNQGTVLTYFKKLFGEQVLIFPINLDFRSEEPLVEIMMQHYAITKFPTTVIDNQKYVGVLKQEDVLETICASLRDSPHCSNES